MRIIWSTGLLWAALVLLMTGASAKAEPGITLVRDGHSDYTIVVDPRCSPSERHAAEDLQMHLEQISGARL